VLEEEKGREFELINLSINRFGIYSFTYLLINFLFICLFNPWFNNKNENDDSLQ